MVRWSVFVLYYPFRTKRMFVVRRRHASSAKLYVQLYTLLNYTTSRWSYYSLRVCFSKEAQIEARMCLLNLYNYTGGHKLTAFFLVLFSNCCVCVWIYKMLPMLLSSSSSSSHTDIFNIKISRFIYLALNTNIYINKYIAV